MSSLVGQLFRVVVVTSVEWCHSEACTVACRYSCDSVILAESAVWLLDGCYCMLVITFTFRDYAI